MKHLKIKVYGKVQGVYYRATAVEKAKLHGIRGFVRNERDGSVYIEAEGDEKALEIYLDWCRLGPSRAKVERIEIAEGDPRQYIGFITIREM